jgi:hypothetical protein
VKQWPLGLEPEVAVSRFLRVRVTAAAAVNAVCYVVWTKRKHRRPGAVTHGSLRP